MRRSALFTLIAFSLFLMACDKSDDNVSSESEIAQEQMFEKYGIKPSGAEFINKVIDVIELDEYKLAFGKKMDQAWYAKYKRNGDEIYSFELAHNLIGDYKYSHCNSSSNLWINNNRLFLQCYLTNEENPETVDNTFGTALIFIDYEKGRQLYGVKSKNFGCQFKNLTELRDLYFIESGEWFDGGKVYSYYVFKNDGMSLWERDTKPGEERGIKGYDPYYFTSAGSIMYCKGFHTSGTEGYTADDASLDGNFTLRHLNLRDYEIDFEKMIDLSPETEEPKNVIYTNIEIASEGENMMKISYKEKKKVIDQVSGNVTHELVGDFYIRLSEIDGEEISRGEVE